MGDLAGEAATRIAGHVKDVRGRYPGILAEMKRMRAMKGQPDVPAWPDWCWLPMGATGAALQAAGPYIPQDIAVVSAVGQWRLLGRRIVVPSEQVAEHAVPGRLAGDLPDLRLPRDGLIEALAGACYYLVMPIPRPDDMPEWVYGCYVHLEQDPRPGQGAELRLVADVGGGHLAGMPVLLTQPTLAWSASALAGQATGVLPGPLGEMATGMSRLLAWWVWPLLGALLDPDTHLARTAVLDGTDQPADVRGAEVWEISYQRPSHLRPA